MTIKAIRMFDGGFISQPFAFGGEEGKEAFDEQMYYRNSLQNYAIDLGDEVILADTGMDDGFSQPRTFGAPLYMGDRVSGYVDALKAAGIDPARVTKILITHKHNDHTDHIKSFPNAKVYLSPEEADAMKLEGENIVRCPRHARPRPRVRQGAPDRLPLHALPGGLREPRAQARHESCVTDGEIEGDCPHVLI